MTSACDCEPDLDDTRFVPLCDYCGTEFGSIRCVHDTQQEPCP